MTIINNNHNWRLVCSTEEKDVAAIEFHAVNPMMATEIAELYKRLYCLSDEAAQYGVTEDNFRLCRIAAGYIPR